jgi:hypothetical protein
MSSFILVGITVAGSATVALGQGGSVEGSVTIAVEVHRQYRSISPYARSRYSSLQAVPSSNEAMNVILFIENSPIFQNLPRPSGPFIIEQHGLNFIPRVLPVPVGTSVEFPNNDDVFHNMVRNAQEVMPDGGTLSVRSTIDDRSVVIGVTDTGPGIPQEIQNTLFEPFVSYGKSHGTGLGLAISKGIVEEHQGSLGFVSEEGKGTTFYIRLPKV